MKRNILKSNSGSTLSVLVAIIIIIGLLFTVYVGVKISLDKIYNFKKIIF